MGVLGLDACRKGWAGIVLAEGCGPRGVFGRSVDDVVARARALIHVDVIGIDMPIGLPDRGRRSADVEAKAIVGPRRSSVFLTPVRLAVEASSYAEAARLNRQLAGEGLSAQAFALAPRILEVDAWVRSSAAEVIEVHPELSFTAMGDGPVPASKHTWAGATTRRRRLADAGVDLPDDLGAAGSAAAVDDVLDAAAVAWTARRHTTGGAVCVPAQPETFSDGWPAAIWR
jgi:predicted RNase H-like nuclease